MWDNLLLVIRKNLFTKTFVKQIGLIVLKIVKAYF